MSTANTSQSKKLMKLIPAVLFAVASWPNNVQAATAPSCINLTQSTVVRANAPDLKVARATNHCSGSQNFRMIWAWAEDGACTSVSRGGWLYESRQIGFPPKPYVSELRKC